MRWTLRFLDHHWGVRLGSVEFLAWSDSRTGGIDTHADFHVAAAIDHNGGVLGVETFTTTTGGHRNLVRWLAAFGVLDKIGVEGTGSYGAGITRHLTANIRR